MKARLALVSVLAAALLAGLSVSAATAFRSGGGTVLKIKADKIALKYNVSKLTAEAGKITIVMGNPSPLLHDVAIKGVKKKGKTVGKGGVSKLTVTLEPGKYQFYCSVPGHAAAGMKGTLNVTERS